MIGELYIHFDYMSRVYIKKYNHFNYKGNKMTDFKDLVGQLKTFYGVKSLESVAEKMGYKSTAATNWRQRKALSDKAMLKYMQDVQDKYNQNDYKEIKLIPNSDTPDTQITIPFYKDFAVSAGFGATNFEGDVELIPFNKNELRAMFGLTSFNKMGIVSVIGDSMYPTLKEGQMLIFQDDGSSIEGGIYIIEYQNEVFVKRLKKRPLSLVSDNKEYSNIEVKDLEELRIIGRVIGAYEIIYKRM